MSPKKKRRTQEVRRCIFCGATGLSKEHIWSDWLKTLIARRKEHTQDKAKFDFDNTTKTFGTLEPLVSKKVQGCPTQKKVRVVCEKCNNGWMSRAVEDAKPIASKLILGERCQYNEDDLRKLTIWLAITTVMQDFIGDSHISPEDRVILMNTSEPPPDWTMWIGYYGGRRWYPFNHTHYAIKLEDRASKKTGIGPHTPECYVQIATFTLRSLLFHAFTATTPSVVATYRKFISDRNFNLFQLWPSTGNRLTWHRFPILDGELELIVNQFSRILGFRR